MGGGRIIAPTAISRQKQQQKMESFWGGVGSFAGVMDTSIGSDVAWLVD